MKTIIVHGGAGIITEFIEERLKGLEKAVDKGFEILEKEDDPVKAVIEAIKVLENDEHFNAGFGSALNLCGDVEMDASIMTSDGRCGAVGCIKGVKNPIEIAYLVMEKTDHILLCGEGATQFARLYGVKYFNPISEKALRFWREYFDKKDRYFKHYKEFYSTVGAVAINSSGRLCAGTSTGGILHKLPGRVGDSAIIGAGTYCSKEGAASATGHGEGIIKNFITKYAVDMLKKYSAKETAELCKKINCKFGIIIVDKNGEIGFSFTTPQFLVGYKNEKEEKILFLNSKNTG